MDYQIYFFRVFFMNYVQYLVNIFGLRYYSIRNQSLIVFCFKFIYFIFVIYFIGYSVCLVFDLVVFYVSYKCLWMFCVLSSFFFDIVIVLMEILGFYLCFLEREFGNFLVY